MTRPSGPNLPEPQTFVKVLGITLSIFGLGFTLLMLWSAGCMFSQDPGPDHPRYDPWELQSRWHGNSNKVGKVRPSYIPQWTSDGREIIFSTGMNLNLKKTTERSYSPNAPTQPGLYRGSIYAVNSETGSLRRLSETTGPNELEYSPHLPMASPKIAYITSRHFDDGRGRGAKERNFEIETLDLTTLERRRITNDAGTAQDEKTDTFPKLSPDGNTLLFVKRSEYRTDLKETHFLGNRSTDMLYATSLDTSELTLVYPRDEHVLATPSNLGLIYEPPTWSPDGSHIAFRDFVYQCTNPQGGCTRKQALDIVYVIESDGTNLTEITRDPREKLLISGPAAWAPDNTTIALAKVNDRAPEEPSTLSIIPVRDPGSTKTFELAPQERLLQVTNIEWHPKGARILVSAIKAVINPSDTSSIVIVLDPEANEQDTLLNQSQGGMCIWLVVGVGMGVMQEPFGS